MDLYPAQVLCEKYEGFRSKPYLCPAGVPTIGFGSTYYPGGRKVSLNDPEIDLDRARAILVNELLHTYAPGVVRLCPGLVPLSVLNNDWGTFCALVDFCYNLGVGRLQTSTLRKKINQQDWEGAKLELLKWNKAGGKVLKGLVKRRQSEVELFSRFN